jgi:hypothetical protein
MVEIILPKIPQGALVSDTRLTRNNKSKQFVFVVVYAAVYNAAGGDYTREIFEDFLESVAGSVVNRSRKAGGGKGLDQGSRVQLERSRAVPVLSAFDWSNPNQGAFNHDLIAFR